MSTWYHTTNSLLHVKTQSEGMTLSPMREPKRSPGEQDAAALLNKMNKRVFVFFKSVCLLPCLALIHSFNKKARKKKKRKKKKWSAHSQRECGRGSLMRRSLVGRRWESKEKRFYFYNPYPSVIYPTSSATSKKCIWTLWLNSATHLWHQL